MEGFTITGEAIKKILEEAIPSALKEELTSSYGSPLRKAIETEIQSQEGAIKIFVREILSDILTNPTMKEKVASELLAQMIQKGMR